MYWRPPRCSAPENLPYFLLQHSLQHLNSAKWSPIQSDICGPRCLTSVICRSLCFQMDNSPYTIYMLAYTCILLAFSIFFFFFFMTASTHILAYFALVVDTSMCSADLSIYVPFIHAFSTLVSPIFLLLFFFYSPPRFY